MNTEELKAEVERLNSELTKARELLEGAMGIASKREATMFGSAPEVMRELRAWLAHQSAPACTHEWDINDQGTATTCSSCGARSSDVDTPAAKGGNDE